MPDETCQFNVCVLWEKSKVESRNAPPPRSLGRAAHHAVAARRRGRESPVARSRRERGLRCCKQSLACRRAGWHPAAVAARLGYLPKVHSPPSLISTFDFRLYPLPPPGTGSLPGISWRRNASQGMHNTPSRVVESELHHPVVKSSCQTPSISLRRVVR